MRGRVLVALLALLVVSCGDDDTAEGSLPGRRSASSPSIELERSELVAGRYRIVRWLGGGGMGRVYEVHDTERDERVALKVLREGLSDDALERFRREVKLTRRILHRNVCRMFDIGADPFRRENHTALARSHGSPSRHTWR